MHEAVKTHADRTSREVIEAWADTDLVLISGANGVGKSHQISVLSKLLHQLGMAHHVVDSTAGNALTELERAHPTSLLLVDDYDRASFELLEAIAHRVSAGAKAVGVAAEAARGSDLLWHLDVLFDQIAGIAKKFRSAHTIRLDPYPDHQIARLLHARAPEPLDAVTVRALQTLAWGRPGWALDLLQLHREGSLTLVPLPRVTRVTAENLLLRSLWGATREAEAFLSPDAITAAVVLSEIGPRGRNGITDLVGAEVTDQLFDAGFVISFPNDASLCGVPELFGVALTHLATGEQLNLLRQEVAHHHRAARRAHRPAVTIDRHRGTRQCRSPLR